MIVHAYSRHELQRTTRMDKFSRGDDLEQNMGPNEFTLWFGSKVTKNEVTLM